MSPLSTLRRIPLFGQGLHRPSLPGSFPAAIARCDRRRPAFGSGQRDHHTVARACLATNPHKSSDLVSVVAAVPFPCRWSEPSWTS
jgi:hypothetical protein